MAGFDSEFDQLMSDVDAELMQTFGVQLRLSEGSGSRDVWVDVERNVSVERFIKTRAVTGRVAEHVLGTLLAKDVPSDLGIARLHLSDGAYRLIDPEPVDGNVEFLLVKDVPENQQGSASTTFLKV